MTETRPICDFFIDRDDVEYIVEIYTTDEGYPDDFGVFKLLDNGQKGAAVDQEPFYDEAAAKFYDWVQADMDDGRDSYPASHY